MAQLTLKAPTRDSLSWWNSVFEKVSKCFKAFFKFVDSKSRCDAESLPLAPNNATGDGLAMSVARVCHMMQAEEVICKLHGHRTYRKAWS
jgi:hypothetical protein